jgi:hypothetical protein
MADNRSIYTEDGWVRAEAVTGHGAKMAAETLAADLSTRLGGAPVRVYAFVDKKGNPTGSYEVQAKADQRRVEEAVNAKGRPHGARADES